jgi:glycosyltransferase 2 family protein
MGMISSSASPFLGPASSYPAQANPVDQEVGTDGTPSPSEPRSLWRSRLLLAFKVALAAGLLVWLARSGKLDFGRLLSIPLSGDLALLVGLLFGSLALPACRWWWLLRIQGLREPFGRVLLLTWAGYFTALVLPGAAGGDLAKGYLILRRRAQGRARALSTVLMDRLLGVYSLLFLGSLAIAWACGRGIASPLILAMAGGTLSLLLGLTAGAALLAYRPTRALLLRILPRAWCTAWDDSLDLYVRNKPGLAGCFLLSIAGNAMVVASFAVAGSVLGRAVPLGGAFLAGPLVILANCLPLSPGGIGVAEAAADGLFAGLAVQGGAELMILVRVCLAGLALPGVFGLFWASRRLRPQLSKSGARGVQL